jgi:hypothetical protein
MKFPLVLLAAIVSSHVIANPKKLKLKGYTPPTPLSVTHQRSTHALIESDGNIWVADFFHTRSCVGFHHH